MADDTAPQVDMQAHLQTYHSVLHGSVTTMIGAFFVLVALVMFSFGGGISSTVLGFLGLILGAISLVIDARSGGGKWTISLVVLVLFAFTTVMKISG